MNVNICHIKTTLNILKQYYRLGLLQRKVGLPLKLEIAYTDEQMLHNSYSCKR